MRPLGLDAISVDDAGRMTLASALARSSRCWPYELDTDLISSSCRLTPSSTNTSSTPSEPGKHIAKAARKAAIQHRSRYHRSTITLIEHDYECASIRLARVARSVEARNAGHLGDC